MCREVVAVAVISPAVGLMAGVVDGVVVPLVNTMALGGPKLAWFRRLKNSARNCSLTFSKMAMVLNSERSRVPRPGPVSVALPKFPYVPKGGRVKALGLNHWLGGSEEGSVGGEG